MPEHHLYDRVKEIVAGTIEARADGTVTFGELSKIGGEIINAAAHVLEALSDRSSHLDDLATSCERLFDEYFAPLDLSGVPNFFEPTVDGLIRSQLRPTIAKIYDLLA